MGSDLDNGIGKCEDPKALQRICEGLTESKIERLLRKWLARLPHPFSPTDRRAGYRYALSILQAEFSLTQVLDRPVVGRIFFEEVIRENLDLGRPGQVQLIFNRRVNARTPGRFRTRTTSPSAGGSTTFQRCGRSASKPTDVSWTSKGSVTTVRSAKTPSSACNSR
ncbi:MAG: hypothetical protein ACREXY_01065 [Gammaproteobacteria bacterium]